jgi:hypothetical protein
MVGFERCPTCREFGWFGEKFGREHQCAPIWEARICETKWENGWMEVRAHDAEEAASKFCQRYDSDGEYSILQSGEAEVEVRKLGEDDVTVVEITAESVPTYYAHARSPQVSETDNG